MEKELKSVEITFSDGSHETYTGDVIVFALEEDGVACRASFRCGLERAKQMAMTMVIQAGKIFREGVSQEGEEQTWTEEGEEGDGFDFSKLF